MTYQPDTQHKLNQLNPIDICKSIVKKMKGITYHKRSKKFQVQIFYNDPNQDTNNKKHIFKSKSYKTIKECIIGKKTIIESICNMFPNYNNLTDFNYWNTYEEWYESINENSQLKLMIDYLNSNNEPEIYVPQPIENQQNQFEEIPENCECNIDLEPITELHNLRSVCGNTHHSITRENLVNMVSNSYLIYTNNPTLNTVRTHIKCPCCRGLPVPFIQNECITITNELRGQGNFGNTFRWNEEHRQLLRDYKQKFRVMIG